MRGDRLKRLRTEKKITQSELGNVINVTKVSISGYENGNRSPDTDTLIKIADYFDVTTDYLLGREEKSKEVKEQPTSLFSYEQIGISQKDYEDLSPYQQEVLNWAINEEALFFKNKSKNVLDMIERLEVAYEVDKVMSKRKNNS